MPRAETQSWKPGGHFRGQAESHLMVEQGKGHPGVAGKPQLSLQTGGFHFLLPALGSQRRFVSTRVLEEPPGS